MLQARLFILKCILIRKSTNCTLLNVLCQFSSACRTRIIGQLLYFEFLVQDQNSVASGSVHSFELHVQQDTLSPSFQANGKNRKHKRNHSNLTAGRWSVNCRIAELSFKNSETFVYLIWFVHDDFMTSKVQGPLILSPSATTAWKTTTTVQVFASSFTFCLPDDL